MLKETELKRPGLIIPPLTPFGADLKVDREALRRGVDYVVQDCGAAMVVAAGVEAQEYHYLTMEERRDLIRMTVDFVDGRCPVAVGVSHPSYRVAVELAHFAEELGAQAVQLLAPLRPFGGEPTQAELIAYFESVARETRLPIVLYLNPGPGADPSPATTLELARLDGVKYVKESSRNLLRVAQLIQQIDVAGHAEYYTTMQMLLITLQLGGSGVTLPPPAARLARLVVEAFVAGDMEEAARLQAQFSLFPAQWMGYGLAPTMKAAMRVLGIDAGDPYPPYRAIGGEALADLERYLRTTDLAKGR
ncbi:MAG: dihydrodipicolinate synthase family protein [Bordetella sp. SCN 67-23]|nr:dihydrodipicolinate synthase family protein [Burkholderiales bacterium]ODS69205.1 MAG: dihydrodipicolinate synthase family protein [Bordetella sp. SCN 67-23]ODU93293.1 MAG: dihydrodipicolinate synthase family protein [Bordetella sp. SCN 68-11]OJW86176.1 MAG: dihydrodipicolinate synthase family protein [Burkholderiales bacterium 67-32]